MRQKIECVLNVIRVRKVLTSNDSPIKLSILMRLSIIIVYTSAVHVHNLEIETRLINVIDMWLIF